MCTANQRKAAVTSQQIKRELSRKQEALKTAKAALWVGQIPPLSREVRRLSLDLREKIEERR